MCTALFIYFVFNSDLKLPTNKLDMTFIKMFNSINLSLLCHVHHQM
jgi:hypothetical protein